VSELKNFRAVVNVITLVRTRLSAMIPV